MQTTEKQEESSQQATEGSGSTPSPMADEGGTSEQLSYMVNAKVLHYDDAGKPILISCANEVWTVKLEMFLNFESDSNLQKYQGMD